MTEERADEALAVVRQGPQQTGTRRIIMQNMLLPRQLFAFLATTVLVFYVTLSPIVSALIGGCAMPLVYYVIIKDFIDRNDDSFHEMTNRVTFYTYWQGEGRRMWLALDEKGKVTGTIALAHVTADVCELFRMSVLSNCRRGGIGNALVSHLLQYATNRGYKVVQLGTLALFTEAQALYFKHGFRIVETFFAPTRVLEVEVRKLEKQLVCSG
jgi:ribosomal protein S18 acetylase RimI-like enzyme